MTRSQDLVADLRADAAEWGATANAAYSAPNHRPEYLAAKSWADALTFAADVVERALPAIEAEAFLVPEVEPCCDRVHAVGERHWMEDVA